MSAKAKMTGETRDKRKVKISQLVVARKLETLVDRLERLWLVDSRNQGSDGCYEALPSTERG